MTSERYDIVAKADDSASAEQKRLMMRALLTERFQLAFHTERKELHSFALVIAKGGPKLKQATPDEIPFRQNSRMGTVARATTMPEFADFLSGPVEKPVVDKTGLTAFYAYTLDWFPATRTPDPDSDEASIFTAVQDQLGLKLESAKAPVETIVVDHAEKPSEN